MFSGNREADLHQDCVVAMLSPGVTSGGVGGNVARARSGKEELINLPLKKPEPPSGQKHSNDPIGRGDRLKGRGRDR